MSTSSSPHKLPRVVSDTARRIDTALQSSSVIGQLYMHAPWVHTPGTRPGKPGRRSR